MAFTSDYCNSHSTFLTSRGLTSLNELHKLHRQANGGWRSSSDALVNEPQPLHFVRVEQISSVKEDRVGQRCACAFQVELLKLGPFRGDYERIAAFGHSVHILHIGHVLENGFGFFHRTRIVDTQDRSLLL